MLEHSNASQTVAQWARLRNVEKIGLLIYGNVNEN